MRTLFTIHAGEYLVADHLPNRWTAWIPAKDSGVDFLLTKDKPRRSVKVQVKLSRSYGFTMPKSWYTLKPSKIRHSKADVWIFVIPFFPRGEAAPQPKFIIVPIADLKKRIPKSCGKVWHLYLHIRKKNYCMNVRGVRKGDLENHAHRNSVRDFTRYLNNWLVLDRCAR